MNSKEKKTHSLHHQPKSFRHFKSFSLLSRLTTAPRQIETAQVGTWSLVVCGYFDTSFSKQVSRPFNQHQWKCESSVITQKQKRKFWGIVWWSACTEKKKNLSVWVSVCVLNISGSLSVTKQRGQTWPKNILKRLTWAWKEKKKTLRELWDRFVVSECCTQESFTGRYYFFLISPAISAIFFTRLYCVDLGRKVFFCYCNDKQTREWERISAARNITEISEEKDQLQFCVGWEPDSSLTVSKNPFFISLSFALISISLYCFHRVQWWMRFWFRS